MVDDFGNRIGQLSEVDIDRISERMMEKMAHRWGYIDPKQHFLDHEYTKKKRRDEDENIKNNKASKRKIVESIIGGAGTVGFLMFLTWVGHQILTLWNAKGGP